MSDVWPSKTLKRTFDDSIWCWLRAVCSFLSWSWIKVWRLRAAASSSINEAFSWGDKGQLVHPPTPRASDRLQPETTGQGPKVATGWTLDVKQTCLLNSLRVEKAAPPEHPGLIKEYQCFLQVFVSTRRAFLKPEIPKTRRETNRTSRKRDSDSTSFNHQALTFEPRSQNTLIFHTNVCYS